MKYLVDTSSWIYFFQKGDIRLTTLLEQDQALIHPLVIGKMHMGIWDKNRDEIFHLLSFIEEVKSLTHLEIIDFVESQSLYGKKIGFIDAHLLASCKISNCGLCTKDKYLKRSAEELGIKII